MAPPPPITSPPASRRKARELALQVLYAVDHSEGARSRTLRPGTEPAEAGDAAAGPAAAPEPEIEPEPERRADARRRARSMRPTPRRRAPRPEPSEPADAAQTFESVAEHFEMAAGAREFARELALETHAREREVDELVSAHARNWRVDRMAVVDRNILRLATYELRFTDTPTAVVLDEAINLARRFGDDPSPGFVNGILDAVARGVRPSPP